MIWRITGECRVKGALGLADTFKMYVEAPTDETAKEKVRTLVNGKGYEHIHLSPALPVLPDAKFEMPLDKMLVFSHY